MEFTQEELIKTGYQMKAAPVDTWRNYDENNPIPGYFEFDWLSARHPDLYHKFALTTIGLMKELNKLVDLTGLDVLDIGAGTGRATMEAASKAKKVTAVDIYESVVSYGRDLVKRAGLTNVSYVLGDRANLPLPDNSFDAAICAWAELDHTEAYRVLKPNGYLIYLLCAPGSLCGDFTGLLADIYPQAIDSVALDKQFERDCPDSDFVVDDTNWNGALLTAPLKVHDFTYTTDYGDYREAAAIYGRLYGPKVKRYILDKQKSTVSWRLRIMYGQVKK